MSDDPYTSPVWETDEEEEWWQEQETRLMSDHIDADLVRKVMGATRMPLNPTPAEFRTFLGDSLRGIIGHSWLVFGDNRRILEGALAYLPKMTDQQLTDLMACVPS